MKAITNHPFSKTAVHLSILLSILAVFTTCRVVESVPERKAESRKTSHNQKLVRIYPDMIKKMIHVKSKDEEPLDFYVFDKNGAIVLYYKMTDGDHKKISELEKGNYTYNVFKNDEMFEAGKLIIK